MTRSRCSTSASRPTRRSSSSTTTSGAPPVGASSTPGPCRTWRPSSSWAGASTVAPTCGRSGSCSTSCWSGRRPFEGADDDALRAAILDPARPAPAFARARPDLPAELFALVARCLEKSRVAGAIARPMSWWRRSSAWPAVGWPASCRPGWRHDRRRPRAIASPWGWCGRWPIAPTARASISAARGCGPTAGSSSRSAPSARRRRRPCRWSRSSPARPSPPPVGPATAASAGAPGGCSAPSPAAAHPEPSRRPSARALAGRLAAAHDGPSRRTALVALLVVAVTSGFMLGWPRRGAARTTTPIAAPVAALQLERLDRSLERLRAAGDPAAAEALFARFVAQPENTAVASTAWLRRAARELASRDLEAALASAGAAYLAAHDERTETRALAAVVEVQLARQRWFEVAAALATIGRSDDPALARAATAVALATRRPLPDQPRSASDASVAALRLGQREPRAVTSAVTLDLDGDGRDEIVALDGQVVRAWRPGGRDPVAGGRGHAPATRCAQAATLAARGSRSRGSRAPRYSRSRRAPRPRSRRPSTPAPARSATSTTTAPSSST
jgi:predicted negative regulator of RcsB-dependent stress response